MKMRIRRRLNPFAYIPMHAVYRMAEGGTIDGDHPHDEADQFDAKAYAESTSATIANLQKDLSTAKRAQAADMKALKDTVQALAEALKGTSTSGGGQAAGGDVDDDGDTTGATAEETPPARRGRPRTQGSTNGGNTTTAPDPALSELQKQIAALSKQLEVEKKRGDTAEERRLAAENRQRNAERDRLLIAAATDFNAISATDAADFLRSRAVYDEDLERWGIRDGEDFIDIAEGVQKYLPKYMLKARNTTGGAGGHSTGGDNGVNRATLKQNAVQAGIAARKNPSNVGRYSKAKSDYESAGGDVTEIINEVASAVI